MFEEKCDPLESLKVSTKRRLLQMHDTIKMKYDLFISTMKIFRISVFYLN